METWLNGEESGQSWDDIFIVMEGGSRAVQGGWLAAVVQIQCFGVGSRGEATERNIVERWSRGSKLVFAPLEGSVAWHGDVGRRKGDTGEGKERKWRQLGWYKFYWAKKWRKSIRSIQLLQIDGEDLKQRWVNLIFLKHM
jgi:hypothetical protein